MGENTNTGHGHVYPREDGVRARCGGPAICPECARDLAKKTASIPADGGAWYPEAADVLNRTGSEILPIKTGSLIAIIRAAIDLYKERGGDVVCQCVKRVVDGVEYFVAPCSGLLYQSASATGVSCPRCELIARQSGAQPAHGPVVGEPCRLLPCPFCGSNAEIDPPTEKQLSTPGMSYEWMVKCSGNRCDANVTDHRSEDEAVKAWNIRAYSHPAAVPAEVMAAVDALVVSAGSEEEFPDREALRASMDIDVQNFKLIRDWLKSLQGAGHGQG